jgi:hypothetical protein
LKELLRPTVGIACIIKNMLNMFNPRKIQIFMIPKRQSESVYRRRTDNTTDKRKSIKGQTTIYKT